MNKFDIGICIFSINVPFNVKFAFSIFAIVDNNEPNIGLLVTNFCNESPALNDIFISILEISSFLKKIWEVEFVIFDEFDQYGSI